METLIRIVATLDHKGLTFSETQYDAKKKKEIYVMSRIDDGETIIRHLNIKALHRIDGHLFQSPSSIGYYVVTTPENVDDYKIKLKNSIINTFTFFKTCIDEHQKFL